jgi:microcystin-dependent protein
MSCTASDLIKIQPLTLSDTFHTWFDRTNEVIDAVSAVNIYNVAVGVTSGLEIANDCVNGNYNGTIVIDTNVGGGVGIGPANYKTNQIVMDFADLPFYLDGGVSANPALNDYYALSDLSDPSQGPAGTPKKIAARYMLPPKVTMGETGGGALEIEGSLVVKNNLSVLGDTTYIQVSDIRVEDKIIELASSPYTAFMIEGAASDIGDIESGMTAYGWGEGDWPDSNNEDIIFKIRSIQRQSSGTTAYIEIHRISEGTPEEIQQNSVIEVDPDGLGLTFDVTTSPVGGNGLVTDVELSPAGVRIKGDEGDKDFLWTNTYNRWATNTNLGVSDKDLFVVSSKFGSYGFEDASRDNIFTFVGASGQDVTLSIANGSLTVTGDGWENSAWKLVKHATPGALRAYQRMSLIHDSGATAYPIATFYAGRTGPVYAGVGVSGWAQHLNVDMVDGAHATQTPTAHSIPVAYSDGRIDPNWLMADAIRKDIVVSGGHAFQVGDVVRYDALGGLTFAIADTIPTAEAIGMVSEVDGNTVTVTTRGYIANIPIAGTRFGNFPYPAVTGSVYFLSADNSGRLIANPDTGDLDAGQVRKAMFLADGVSSGYVLNYVGSVFGGDSTDRVYLPLLTPVGSVQPFAGATSGVPEGWLLCDGKSHVKNSYPDLFDAIGNAHFANAKMSGSGGTTIIFADNIRNLAANNPVKIEWTNPDGQVVSSNCTVSTVNSGTRTVTLTVGTPALPTTDGVDVRVYGRVAGSDTNMVFFVPDLRGRTPIGVSTPTIGLGVQGGMTAATLPEHKHFSVDTAIGDGPQSAAAVGSPYTGGLSAGSVSNTIPTMPPYIGMHWIIRAIKTLPALIITGHHHDNRYVRYDAEQTLIPADKNRFHTNAAVLSDGTVGRDKFENRLAIQYHGDGVTGLGDWEWWASTLPAAGSYTYLGANTSQWWSQAALNVMGGDASRAVINIFNNNANWWSPSAGRADEMGLNFYGVGISGATAPARFAAGIRASIQQIDVDGIDLTDPSRVALGSITGSNRRYFDISLGGITDGRPAFAIYRDEHPSVAGSNSNAGWDKTIRYRLPHGLTSESVHKGYMTHVMLRYGRELVEYTGTSLSGSDLHVTGAVKIGQGSLSSGLDSDAKILTVDSDTGVVHTRKMLEVTGNTPPTDANEVANYPEGFVWYKTDTGGEIYSPGLTPIRGIIMWSGELSQIPSGWALCDGREVGGIRTPDLRGRFIVGAGGTVADPAPAGNYDLGASGGDANVTLTTAQIPAHKHKTNRPNLNVANADVLGGTLFPFATSYSTTVFTEIESSSVGSGEAHENRPPYYALAYIMRVA